MKVNKKLLQQHLSDPAGPDGLPGACSGRPTDHVEHGVDLPDNLLERLALVVDDHLGAEVTHEVRVGARGRRQDCRPSVDAELNGELE